MSTPEASAMPTDRDQLRAVMELLMSGDLARSSEVPLHHSPEALTRAPAKVEILVNSLLVFIERGVGPVTVQDLLDAARISRRTFYKYFRNKVDVLESLYKLAIDIMVLRYKADIGNAATVSQAAQRMVDVFFGYHRDLAPVIRMMQEEAVRSDSPLAPHRAAAMSAVVLLVNNELQRIAGRRIDPLTIQSLLWAMEGTSIELLRREPVSAADIAHGKDVISEIVIAAFERALTGS